MRADAAQYLFHLLALLPEGPAWPREPGVLADTLGAEAEGLARIHNRAADLVDEADPRAALQMLPDWERVCGLPGTCGAGAVATTLQERRVAVVARLTATGGQSPAHFVGLAEALGYQVELKEWRPFVAGRGRCGQTLGGPHANRHHWSVTVLAPRVTWFRAGASQGGDRLGKIARAQDLECLLHRLKPGHTQLIVSYEGV
jgi:uncharacterized protein YmfQ (DUF2313 family)